MDDVGAQKGHFGTNSVETIAGALAGLLFLGLIYEAGSYFNVSDPTVTVFSQAKCRLWRSIAESRITAVDARLGDVEREMIRTKEELTIAEDAVQRSLHEGMGTKVRQSAIAAVITERDRLASQLEDLRTIRAKLFLTLKNLDNSRRRTSVEGRQAGGESSYPLTA